MEDLEPWNLFTNDFVPDDAAAGDGADDNEHNEEGGAGGGGDEPFAIPSPVQGMQVKDEPVDETFDDGSGDSPFGFHSAFQRESPNDEQDQDDALFDFSADNSNSAPPPIKAIKLTPSQIAGDLSGLSREDAYYHSIIRYEDSIIYICPACGAEFNTQENWKTHLNVVHQYNTRRGLNFIQVDKLYHECLECHKRIAMHSMENLIKHKFTHLPYRCSKCNVCKREYKYRQDLMVHLRMNHRDDLIALAKDEHKKQQQLPTVRSILNKPSSAPRLTIGHVKENATDMFDSNLDNVEVRNEVLNDEDDEGDNSLPGAPPARRVARHMQQPIFIDDGSTNGSSNDQQRGARSKPADDIDESLEEYILFTCPQCGTECETHAQWRQHIEFVHDFGTRKGLNMRDINGGQAQCIECNQNITANTIQNLQLHKFNHLPHKQWMNCKLCFTSFSLSKEIIKHLADKHHLAAEQKPTTGGSSSNNNNDDIEDSQEPFGFGDDDYDDSIAMDDRKKSYGGSDGTIKRREERDEFEQHMDFLCPQCGKEFYDKKLWRKHLVDKHKLDDLDTLNFELINDRQVRCRECDKVITNAYGIQNAQQHSMTHMQYKSFAKCRLCRKQYTDRKGLTKHLRNSHGIGRRQHQFKGNAESSPFGNSAGKPFAAKSSFKPATWPQKEIVRHKNYTFEICYLDEDDNDNSRGGFGGGGGTSSSNYDFAKGDAHLYRRFQTPTNKSNNSEQLSRHRCVDCGSSFPTYYFLQQHIKKEHDFIDFTAKNSPKKDSNPINEEKSNDTDDLLVVSRDVEVKPDEPTTMECNFIYICPQCGVEFRLRHLWRRHINMEHNFDKREALDFRTIDKFRYQCKTCHEVVQSSKLKGLQDHKFRHCPYRQYLKCLICGQAYNHKPNMLSHLRQRHNIVEIEPSNTSLLEATLQRGKEYERDNVRSTRPNDNVVTPNPNRPPGLKTVEDVISYHNAVDHESITYHCPTCTETFDSHVFWRKHIVDEHNLNSREGLNFRQLDDHHYICLQCYKRVTVTHTKGAIGQLQSHKFRHLPYKSFRCTVCMGEFVRKQMFFKHLDKITNKCSGAPADFGVTADAEPNESQQLDDDTTFKNDNTFSETTTDDTPTTTKYWPARTSLPAQPTANESTSENQGCFTLSCPQCGLNFETTRGWREHINIEHNLNSRSVLNFRKINPKLHLCLECNEHVNGRKLRDLQVHKFKHLPYGAYLHCRYCPMKYFHISNMQEHLKNKHPQMLQKMRNENYDDEETGNMDVDDEEDAQNFGGGDYDDAASPPCLDDMLDIDLLEAEAEIEEVDPDNVESDDQYLLG